MGDHRQILQILLEAVVVDVCVRGLVLALQTSPSLGFLDKNRQPGGEEFRGDAIGNLGVLEEQPEHLVVICAVHAVRECDVSGFCGIEGRHAIDRIGGRAKPGDTRR